jgi:hypothetical protein
MKLLDFLPAKEEVITYPEITKKISTPKYPLGSKSLLKWLTITATTANALRPSISGRYFFSEGFGASRASRFAVSVMPFGGRGRTIP